jgi:regulator of sigma E protease
VTVIDFKVERFDQEYLLKIKPNIVLSDDNLGNKVNKRNGSALNLVQ